MTQTEKNNIKLEKRIQIIKEKLKAFQSSETSYSVLDAEHELREIIQHIEVEILLYISCMLRYKLGEQRKHMKMFFLLLLVHAAPDFQQRVDFVPTKA